MLTSVSLSKSRYWGGDGGSLSLSLSGSGCWCCGGGGGGVCNCGEGAFLSSEALFLAITVLSVCVQVVFTLGVGCTPSGSLPYLQRRCPVRKYMMGWYILGVVTWFLLLMLRMDVLMRVIASSLNCASVYTTCIVISSDSISSSFKKPRTDTQC